tara:strand:- start:496 stop:1185 length:690 start_codon:yes stop_codon:yes gene_type:complete
VNSLYDFIIEPIGDRYENKKQIEDKTLILNTSIETFKAINNKAVVISTPTAYDTPIKEGMEVIVHHNIFRRWYDVKGREKNSKSYFKDNLFFCSPDQLYLYKDKEWNTFNDRCFIKPIKTDSIYTNKHFESNLGILYYSNEYLKNNNIKVGDIVGYRHGREFEFTINDELLFCMKSHDIILTYDNKGNEEEYNPSWAGSSERVDKGSSGTDCRYGGGCVCGPTQERGCH